MRFFLFSILFPFVVGHRLTEEENDQLQETCGRCFLSNETSTDKSMNTSMSTRNEAPFAIQFRRTPKDGSPEERLRSSESACSGTIISRRHILTAAHCFNSNIPKCGGLPKAGYQLAISAPTNCENATTCDSYLKPVIISARRAYVPHVYTSDCFHDNRHVNATMVGDVAIVELEEDIKFSPTVQPACVHMKTGHHKLLTLYGYGHNGARYTYGTLRKHDSKTMSKEKCQMLADKHGYRRTIKPDEVCSTSNVSMACKGDSGSGLIFRAGRNQKAYVVAVTSWGPPCHIDMEYPHGYLDVNAKIVPQMDWIWAVTGIHYEKRKYTEADRKEFMKKVLTIELDPDVNQPQFS